jgi:hypothetical protein
LQIKTNIIMTHPNYSRQQLQFLKLSELKAIASQIGADVADKRIRASFIQAILDHTEIVISESQPEITSPTITDYQALCHATTGTRALHELRDWCAARQLLQGEDFEALYRNVLNCMARFPYDKAKQLDLTLGCIDRAILEQSELSEAILNELQIEIVDLSVTFDDMVIPHGQDAYWAYYDGVKVAAISTWGSGYFSTRSSNSGCSDPYSAVLEILDAGDVEIARATVERDLEIKTMQFTENEKAIFKGAKENDYADCFEDCGNGGFNSTWSFAVIDASGLDPKVARGAIASLVKKGMVEVSDWESKGRADDMVLALTTEGVKAGMAALMPEYA